MAQAINIFNFLKEYNLLSNPVVTELDKQKWSLDLSDLPVIDEIQSIFNGNDLEDLIFLKVKKPSIEPCPKPDDSLLEWLDNDWHRLSISEVRCKEKILREHDQNGEVHYREEAFNDDVSRINKFDRWITKRESWREIETPREKGLNLYNKLFRLYSDIKKEPESVELIIGDGIINWETEERLIHHPVLLQKVFLDFEPEIPMFIVRCEEIKAEIYSAMLRVLTSVNQKMLTDIIQDVDEQAYHLSEQDNTKGLFQRLIHVIDEKGEFVEAPSLARHAQITSKPVLFLRKRTLGYSAFLENIISEISEKGESILPTFFNTMVGNHKEDQNIDSISEDWNHSGIDKDILLTLPANNEQLKIIKYLDKYGAVLVQGPPGTGKTHTIANLIGHLLSQGSSVLVTSHTEKALMVLKDKVYKDQFNKELNLQSLCISLLSTKSQKKELDEAINEIASKGTTLDLHEAEIRIKKLEGERSKLIDESKLKSAELLEIRALEYKDLVYDNQTITPIDAAKFIKAGKGVLDYIPGETTDDTLAFPLSTEEVHLIYSSNEKISVEEELVLNSSLPDFNDVWDNEMFTEFKSVLDELNICLKKHEPTIKFIDSITVNELENQKGYAFKLKKELQTLTELQRYLLQKTIQDPVYPRLWDDVIKEFDLLYNEFKSIEVIKFKSDFVYDPELITNENLTVLLEIVETKKEIPVTRITSLLKPKWNGIKNNISNGGQPIERMKEYEDLSKIFSYEISKRKLIKQINKLLAETDSQIKLDDPMFEIKGEQQKNNLLYAMNWYSKKWIHFMDGLTSITLAQDNWKDKNMIDLENPLQWLNNILEMIQAEIDFMIKKIKHELAKQEHKKYCGFLYSFQHQNDIFDQMISAAKVFDIKKYEINYLRIKSILMKRPIMHKRNEILNRLSKIAPVWSMEIKNRRGIHGKSTPPKEIESAWKWMQLVNQIERIDAYDPNSIQQGINSINNKLFKNARLLAYESAWFQKIKNRTTQQAQAIEGWRTTIRQIGKGKGKRAPELMRKARELMPLCQTAIPVWIMSLNRVVENFDPTNNKFDVVIIDEASQSDILALAALYLGKKIIIVGDDEQVSPDNVGLKNNEINALIEMYLHGIPINHLFNGQTSLYDMAKSSGFKPLMLTEHFRCLPEIIEFSNALSYNGKIKPLRDSSMVKIKPPVVEYRVPNGQRDQKKINENEAMHVASLVCAIVSHPAYEGKTIGVISMLGLEQSYEVDKLLQTYLNPVEYENRQIQCGTPPQFQGDERDIILLSIVDSPNENGGPIRLLSEDGRNDMYRKRYNVAASRAKDQLWVVHSLNPEIDLKPDDIRLRLIKHAQNPSIASMDARLESAESPFEEAVMMDLLNNGYKVMSQLKVGSYRIDMVVEYEDNRIAIECDGEKWHTQDDLPNDLKRQAILERLGWKFIRIRGSVYYRDPIETMDIVFKELKKQGILPDFNRKSNNDSEREQNGHIISQIKNKASDIRREWNIEEYEEAETNEDLRLGILDSVCEEKVNINEISSAEDVGTYNKFEQLEFVRLEQKEKKLIMENKTNRNEALDLLKNKESIDSTSSEASSCEEKNISNKIPKDDKLKNKPVFDFRTKHIVDLKDKNEKTEKINEKYNDEKEPSKNHSNVKKPLFDFRNRN